MFGVSGKVAVRSLLVKKFTHLMQGLPDQYLGWQPITRGFGKFQPSPCRYFPDENQLSGGSFFKIACLYIYKELLYPL
jgi:hypothetical protein